MKLGFDNNIYFVLLYLLISIEISKDNWQDKPEINSNDREVRRLTTDHFSQIFSFKFLLGLAVRGSRLGSRRTRPTLHVVHRNGNFGNFE